MKKAFVAMFKVGITPFLASSWARSSAWSSRRKSALLKPASESFSALTTMHCSLIDLKKWYLLMAATADLNHLVNLSPLSPLANWYWCVLARGCIRSLL